MKVYLVLVSLFFTQTMLAQEEPTSPDAKIWSFEDCVIHALENNITVKEAALNKEIAAVDFSKSKSAKLPNLFGSASQNFANGTTIDPITSNYVTDQIHSTNVGVNSTMTLFQGGQLSNQMRQNRLLLDQSVLQEEVEKNNIVLSLMETYIQVLYSKESISIAESNLAASEKEVQRAKARLDAETLTMGDYTEVQSQAATNRYNLIAAKNTYEQYIIELKQILELSPMEELEIASIDDEAELLLLDLDKMEVYNSALNYLPEIEASNLGMEANEKELDIANGGYLPTLALSGSLGSGYTSINDNSYADQFNVNFNQRIGLTLSVPIFNRNQTKSAVQTALVNIKKAQIQKQSVEKEIYKKVGTAYQNALSSRQQLMAAETSQESAKQSYDLAKKKYELGDLSTTDLVLSQNTYTNAQQNYLQAKYLNVLYFQLLQFYQGNDLEL